ncbi:MAG: hypothetical protein QW379_07780 [Thermoplasmata archaeon]
MRRIFVYHGFDVEAENGLRALRACRGGMEVRLELVESGGEVGEEELSRLISGKTGPGKTVVISLGCFSAGARRLAEERGVQLWDRGRVEEEAGRVIVAELDTRRARLPEDSLLEALLGRRGAREEEFREPSPETPPITMAGGEAMVRPRVTLEEARRLAGELLDCAFRFDLRFMPYYCFSYSVDAKNSDLPGHRSAGVVLVNGMSGEASEWRGREPLSPMSEDVPRLEPAIEQSRAEDRARDRVVELSTRVIHTKREKKNVTIYEKKTVRPSPEAVRLEFRGLLYLPVWCIEGSDGAIVLDALEGGVLRRELLHPPTGEAAGDSMKV